MIRLAGIAFIVVSIGSEFFSWSSPGVGFLQGAMIGYGVMLLVLAKIVKRYSVKVQWLVGFCFVSAPLVAIGFHWFFLYAREKMFLPAGGIDLVNLFVTTQLSNFS